VVIAIPILLVYKMEYPPMSSILDGQDV